MNIIYRAHARAWRIFEIWNRCKLKFNDEEEEEGSRGFSSLILAFSRFSDSISSSGVRTESQCCSLFLLVTFSFQVCNKRKLHTCIYVTCLVWRYYITYQRKEPTTAIDSLLCTDSYTRPNAWKFYFFPSKIIRQREVENRLPYILAFECKKTHRNRRLVDSSL